MELASCVENFEMVPKVLENLCTSVVKGGASRVVVRLLVSHEDLCHMDLVTDVKCGTQGVSSAMILRHQGRGRVRSQSQIHTHTHTHIRTHCHTQRAVHLKVDHTTAKERFLPITTASLGCYHFPFQAYITCFICNTQIALSDSCQTNTCQIPC